MRHLYLSNSTIGLINPHQKKLWNILMSSSFADFTLTRISPTLQRPGLVEMNNTRPSLIFTRIETRVTMPGATKKFLSKNPTI